MFYVIGRTWGRMGASWSGTVCPQGEREVIPGGWRQARGLARAEAGKCLLCRVVAFHLQDFISSAGPERRSARQRLPAAPSRTHML